MNIPTVIDHERGCGWRKEGGIYLMASGIPRGCGKLPIPMRVCPTCNAGIKPARGFTWFDPRKFTVGIQCKLDDCGSCILANPPEKAGLIWIGEKFYSNPQKWTNEANSLGVSRRISRVPKGFEVGKTWIFVGHRLAIPDFSKKKKGTNDPVCYPGIFHAFLPDRIEYITKGNETEEELEALVKRGLTPVKVERAGQLPLAIAD